MATYISTEEKPQCNTRKRFSCLLVWYSSVAIIVGGCFQDFGSVSLLTMQGGESLMKGSPSALTHSPGPLSSFSLFSSIFPPPFNWWATTNFRRTLVGRSGGKSLLTALKCAPSPPFYPLLQFNGINLQRNPLTQPASDAAFRVLLLNSFCVFTSRQL